jgi:hypothetical protein
MPAAIIVAGVVRELANASSSWKIAGDYYLFADEYIREPQSQKIIGRISITDITTQSKVEFRHISILASNDGAYITSIDNLYMKILSAYEHIKDLGYDKIVLIRPDLFMVDGSADVIDNLDIQPRHLAVRGVLNQGDSRTGFRPALDSDSLMCMDLQTFKVLAEFYNYMQTHKKFLLDNKFDVHTGLARYIIESDLIVQDIGCDYVVLRSNTDQLFRAGNVTVDLLNKARREWWDQNITGITEEQHRRLKLIEKSRATGGILKLRPKNT